MKVTPTVTIQLSDKDVIVVADSSPQVKELVGYIDDWRQQEADLTSQLLMVKSALRDIQNVLATQIQNDRAKDMEVQAEKSAQSEGADSQPNTN